MQPMGQRDPECRPHAEYKREPEGHPLAEKVRHITGWFIEKRAEEKTLSVDGREIPIWDVAPDIEHYHEQSAFLRYARLSHPITFLVDHDPIQDRRREIPVLIKLLKPFGLASILMADALRTMGVTLRLVTEGEAKQIFADRVSDFILSRVMATGASTVSDTIVDSRRKGDTVLYAMGYFFSTGLACGTSTPATVQLPPGRYSFGIMNHGVPDFEPVVWSIPTADGHVDLKKPTLVEGSRT